MSERYAKKSITLSGLGINTEVSGLTYFPLSHQHELALAVEQQRLNIFVRNLRPPILNTTLRLQEQIIKEQKLTAGEINYENTSLGYLVDYVPNDPTNPEDLCAIIAVDPEMVDPQKIMPALGKSTDGKVLLYIPVAKLRDGKPVWDYPRSWLSCPNVRIKHGHFSTRIRLVKGPHDLSIAQVDDTEIDAARKIEPKISTELRTYYGNIQLEAHYTMIGPMGNEPTSYSIAGLRYNCMEIEYGGYNKRDVNFTSVKIDPGSDNLVLPLTSITRMTRGLRNGDLVNHLWVPNPG